MTLRGGAAPASPADEVLRLRPPLVTLHSRTSARPFFRFTASSIAVGSACYAPLGLTDHSALIAYLATVCRRTAHQRRVALAGNLGRRRTLMRRRAE